MSELDNTEAIVRKFEPVVTGLSLHELTVLNRMVVERIRTIQKAGAIMYMSKFNVGDRVFWDGKDGERRSGIIMRLNHKTASVKTSEDGYWKVSPHFLNKEH